MNPIIKPISIVLKEARENKGVSLEEVHKATKIHPNILRSLEDGTTLGLSHVYVKSYIKIYAKYLGINQQELEKYFHPAPASLEKKPRLDIPFEGKSIKLKSFQAKGLSKLSSLASRGFQIKRFRKPIIVSIVFLAILILILNLIKGSHSKDAIVLGKVTIEGSGPASQPVSVKDDKPTEPQKEAMPKIKGDLMLTISAKEDTWMQIKGDGGIVYVGILKKGASDTWQAKESLELWIANAGTIDIELNGKKLEPLGPRGKLLKSVLITKDGIEIKK
jgi:hypothetical protein